MRQIEISIKTIIFTVVFLIFLWIIYNIFDIILLLFVAFILTSAIRPLVDRLEQWKIPRVIGILLVYIVGISILYLIIKNILPPLIMESSHFGNQFPAYLNNVLAQFNISGISIGTVQNQIGPITENAVKITLGLFSNLFSFITVLVFTFYFLLERKYLHRYLTVAFGSDYARIIFDVIEKIEYRLGAWVRGQLFLMFTIGIATYIGLFFLGMEYALPLALIAGLLEIVPMVGPIISAVPAILVALAISQNQAVMVTILYLVIQQLENNLIVPVIMRRAVGLPNIITLIALMIGGKIGGVLGAILSVPVVVAGVVVIKEFLSTREALTKEYEK